MRQLRICCPTVRSLRCWYREVVAAAYRRAFGLLANGDGPRDEAAKSHCPHRDQRGRLHRASRRGSRMADVPPGTKRFLWHERFHEVHRYEGARSEDLRNEPPDGGEVRLKESAHCLFTPPASSGSPIGRSIRERCHRPICAPSPRATWQGYLVDGWRRDHRLLS